MLLNTIHHGNAPPRKHSKQASGSSPSTSGLRPPARMRSPQKGQTCLESRLRQFRPDSLAWPAGLSPSGQIPAVAGPGPALSWGGSRPAGPGRLFQIKNWAGSRLAGPGPALSYLVLVQGPAGRTWSGSFIFSIGPGSLALVRLFMFSTGTRFRATETTQTCCAFLVLELMSLRCFLVFFLVLLLLLMFGSLCFLWCLFWCFVSCSCLGTLVLELIKK